MCIFHLFLSRALTYGTSCAKCSAEPDRYEPFVLAFNHALQELKKINNLPLRPASDLEIMFQRQDPIPISATHSGMQSKRKPDITIIALAAAIAAYDVGKWHDLAMKHGPYPPKGHLGWEQQLLSLEAKLNLHALGSVPEAYEKKPIKHNPPQTFKHMMKELDEINEAEKADEASTGGKKASSSSKVTTDSMGQPGMSNDRFFNGCHY